MVAVVVVAGVLPKVALVVNSSNWTAIAAVTVLLARS